MTENVAPGTQYPFGPGPAAEAIEQLGRIIADRPMTKITMPIGGDCWIVHRNQAARDVLVDRRLRPGAFPYRRAGRAALSYSFPTSCALLSSSKNTAPAHATTPTGAEGHLASRRVAEMRASAVTFANQLIDQMSARAGVHNLVAEYSVALPIEMLSNLLGVPSSDREKFEQVELGHAGHLGHD